MAIYLFKTLLSAIIIVLVTEVSKRSGYLGGLIKSLPLISLITFVMLYLETRNTERVAALSFSTFWFVLPTLPPFLLFAYLLRHQWDFWPSMGVAVLSMLVGYLLTGFVLTRLGVTF